MTRDRFSAWLETATEQELADEHKSGTKGLRRCERHNWHAVAAVYRDILGLIEAEQERRK